MILSICFSGIFYWTSTKGLDFQAKSSTNGKPPQGDMTSKPLIVGMDNNGQREVITANSAEELNKQLKERTAGIKATLMQRLVTLNVAALIGGSVLSFYLARRTLRPIEAAVEAQNRFASDASHEFRTPLTIMLAETEVVLNKRDLSLERAKRALRSNYQELVRLRELSEGLLQLAQSTRPTPAHELATVTLDETINDAVNQVLKLAQTKRIAIRADAPKMLVKGDARSILQTLTILLDNAIKYSPNGSTISIDCREDHTYAYISINDEGPGIAPEELPHIFERFYRADKARSEQKAGYGLGLTIAKRLTEQYGGHITVQSTLKKGSTFTIKLPKPEV